MIAELLLAGAGGLLGGLWVGKMAGLAQGRSESEPARPRPIVIVRAVRPDQRQELERAGYVVLVGLPASESVRVVGPTGGVREVGDQAHG